MNSENIKKVTNEAIEQLITALNEGRSQTLTQYLAAIGRFHRYSLRNVMLIASQKPTATHVAGFHAWHKLGRFVKKGEKGILILAPIIRGKNETKEQDETDESSTAVGFRAAYVFDISQTDGQELPTIGSVNGDPREYRERLARFQYLGPLRSYPPRHLAFAQQHDSNWNAGGGFAWDVVRKDETVRRLVNEWLSSRDKLQTPYELMVREFVGVDDLEPTLFEQLKRLQGAELLAVDGTDARDRGEPQPEGILDASIDVEQEARTFQNAIKAADIERLDELVLIDQRTNTIVSHRDVGIGISQVLPVLVAAFGSSGKILAMEQPEIHLHPALQAELGDVFITSGLGPKQNTLILETHSEHLILRIMRRMRETANGELPKEFPSVRPEDVSILYVEPRGSTSIVRVLELDAQGDLLDPWPGGFFEEGFRERFS
jgi:hypothetical protein